MRPLENPITEKDSPMLITKNPKRGLYLNNMQQKEEAVLLASQRLPHIRTKMLRTLRVHVQHPIQNINKYTKINQASKLNTYKI